MVTMDVSLVQQGVGLPRMWWTNGPVERLSVSNVDYASYSPIPLPGPDGLNSMALTRRLAVWAGDDGEEQAYWLELPLRKGIAQAWLLRSSLDMVRGFDFMPRLGRPTEALAAILTRIGRDHRIRRALDWTVEEGTLAKVWRAHGEGERPWAVETEGEGGHLFFEKANPHGWSVVPTLAGITDPTEALAAIDVALRNPTADPPSQ